MKQFKDPFEAALEEEQEESPPESPVPPEDTDAGLAASAPSGGADASNEQEEGQDLGPPMPAPSSSARLAGSAVAAGGKSREEDEDEDEDENMEVELGKLAPGGDPDKMSKMQAILSQFTEEQMNRYESFRRSGFQKATMKRLLVSVTGTQKISMPMTIVMSGIAKMFVGELVETARIVMTERKESGPIRPCHIREAFRRLKIEGKVPKRTVSRLFR